MWPDYHNASWPFAVMGSIMLLFVVVLIVGLVVLLRYLAPQHKARFDQSSAERTLAERYAQGEIDEQEYRQRLHVLRHGESSP